MSASTMQRLADLGYVFVPNEGRKGGQIRNAANDTIVSLGEDEIRAWLCGVEHGRSNLTSCIHEKTSATHVHPEPVASCPWCIVARKDRELAALRKMLARLEAKPKETKRG